MIGELTIGRRYKLTLRSRTFQGHLEGTLRATDLPAGAAGNEDGQHCIWVSGETFEWFLRLDDIATVEEIDDASDPVPPLSARRPCNAVARALRARGMEAARSSRPEARSEPFFRCLAAGNA